MKSLFADLMGDSEKGLWDGVRELPMGVPVSSRFATVIVAFFPLRFNACGENHLADL